MSEERLYRILEIIAIQLSLHNEFDLIKTLNEMGEMDDKVYRKILDQLVHTTNTHLRYLTSEE